MQDKIITTVNENFIFTKKCCIVYSYDFTNIRMQVIKYDDIAEINFYDTKLFIDYRFSKNRNTFLIENLENNHKIISEFESRIVALSSLVELEKIEHHIESLVQKIDLVIERLDFEPGSGLEYQKALERQKDFFH